MRLIGSPDDGVWRTSGLLEGRASMPSPKQRRAGGGGEGRGPLNGPVDGPVASPNPSVGLGAAPMGSGETSQQVLHGGWGGPIRGLVSLWLAYHVLAMFVSPWAVPPTSELAVSVQRYVAHYQTLLYLNHGYRFFAPDPGPASVVEYEIERADGWRIQGLFPDRQAINRDYPRLNYHRWFMWSETLGRLFGQWVTTAEFQQYLEVQGEQIEQLREQGLALEADRLQAQVAEDQRVWLESESARQRILTPVALELLQRHEGQEIRLTLNRRMIPSLTEARMGMQPSDPRLLDPARAFELGRWRWNADGQALLFLEPQPPADSAEAVPGAVESLPPLAGGGP